MHSITVAIRPRQGALIRLLGLAERRGFSPIHVEGRMCESGQAMFVDMNVSSSRPLEHLLRQIEKLADVIYLKVHPRLEAAS